MRENSIVKYLMVRRVEVVESIATFFEPIKYCENNLTHHVRDARVMLRTRKLYTAINTYGACYEKYIWLACVVLKKSLHQ